jgi:hypothetical protein
MAGGRIQNVQIEGIPETVNAYKQNKIPAFSVGDGRDINIRYNGESMDEGAQLLNLWLNKLDSSGTYQLYQLRLYDAIKPGDRITNKTLYDLSFNFRLRKREENMPALNGNAGGMLNNNQIFHLLQEMQDLKVRNALLEMQSMAPASIDDDSDDDDEPEKPAEKTAGQKIGQAVIDQSIPVIGEIIRNIAGAFTGNKLQPSTALAGPTIVNSTNVEEEKKIAAAIERLKKQMPPNVMLGDVLSKLADLGDKNRSGLHTYMNMLMAM